MSEINQNHDPMLVHRLRSACGHLKSTVVAFETGQPNGQTLHQLGAVEASIREISLAIVKFELIKNLNALQTSECDEERRTATQHILEIFERHCRKLGIR